ncbi:MAG: hypothetical protein JWQ43_648 [Glaciihabitans sp.]|nr:hypothetical protein [Glaciihabitans sp.]
MTRVDEVVVIEMTAEGIPAQLWWRSQLYRVTDTPTRLGGLPDFVLDFVTHPPSSFHGWRFQGTTSEGATLVFDISDDPERGRWRLLRTYD